MVLEEASAAAESFSDGENGSESERSPSDWRYGYVYPLEELAKPAPLSGFTSGYAKAKIDVHLAMLSQLAQRRLTDKEVEINARNLARGISVNSYAVMLGWAGATFQVSRNLDRLTLPFMDLQKRGYSFNKLGPLQGQISRFAWQGVRLAIYGQCWAVVTGFAGFVWANGYVQLQLQTDPNLKDLFRAIQKRTAGDRKTDRDTIIGTIPDQMRKRRGEDMRDSSDSMAPGDAYSTTSSDNSSDSSILSEVQRTRYERMGETHSHRPHLDNAMPSEGSETSYRDEASPTGGLGPFDDGARSGDRHTSQSAWTRVREQAFKHQVNASASAQVERQLPAQQPREPSRDHDGYSFSSKDQDPQITRAQAQKEFDAQLERERKGASDTGGSPRKW